MKAHIPMTSQLRKSVNKDIERYAKLEVERQSEVMIRKFFKLGAWVLNEDFGFGHDRIMKFVRQVSVLIDKSREDEIFWEHIDRQIVDRLDIPFDRDYTDFKRNK